MLIDRQNWPLHRSWLILTLAATAAAAAWYAAEAALAGRLPSGNSRPGFILGIVGGLLILFEMSLWLRKKVRAWRLGSAQTWMRAHIWLGLLCLPLLILHSGLRLGGTLSTVLMVLLVVVSVSGVWGLLLQQTLPTRLLQDAPAESVYAQIDHAAVRLVESAEQLVRSTGAALPEKEAAPEAIPAASMTNFAIGVARAAPRAPAKAGAKAEAVQGADLLQAFFQETLRPFLLGQSPPASPLRTRPLAQAAFERLRGRVDPAAHHTVDALQVLWHQRRRLDRQARVHFWLHSWLWIHLPLSAALVVLMFVHAWAAVTYW